MNETAGTPEQKNTPFDTFVFDAKIRESIVPPIGLPIAMGGFMFKVTYRNPGKMRFSAELVAIFLKGSKPDDPPFAIMADGTKKTMDEFEAWRKINMPDPREKGRNPQNVTLDVKSGTFASKGGL